MSVIIRLQNLPWSIDAQGIRQFFHGLSIPDGGVYIIGGKDGDAFITFSTDEDARRAMLKDGNMIENIPIRLFLSSKTELHNVTIATYGTLLPLMGSTLTEQFSHLTERCEHGTRSSGLIGQRGPTVPRIGNLFPPSVVSKDWPQGIVRPLGISVPEPKQVADIGIRPPSNKLVFSERHSPDAVIGSSSAENSLQIYSIEHGQLGGDRSSSLEISDRQKSVEKRNSSSRMYEESAAKVMRLQNHDGQDGPDKASLLKQFAKINDDLYQCMKMLAEHSDTGLPALGREFLMTCPASEFMSRDMGHKFGHRESGIKALARNISHVSHEEPFRYDACVSCLNENESRTIESLFTEDVSRIDTSGSMKPRAIGNRDPRLLSLNTVPRSDLNLSFPGLKFIHSLLGQGLDLGLLNDIRLGAGGSSLGVRNDNRGFETGHGERRLHREFPTFGHTERQSQIGRNFRGEKSSSGLVGAPGNYEIGREFLDRLADVYDAKGKVGAKQPCKISRKDIFSRRSGCGLCICVRNFPVSYSYREFSDFFYGRGIPTTGFKLVTDGFGKPRGLAYVKFNSPQATLASLKLDGRVVDGCRVSVERCSEAEYEDAVDNHKPSICVEQGQSRSRSPIERHILPNKKEKVCVVVKNLSSKTTIEDIRKYFSNSVIAECGGPFMLRDFDGQPKHMALVRFNSARDFEAAILKNRRCRLLIGAAVKVVGIKLGEFLHRLKISRISRIEKSVALDKPRATLRPAISAKLKTRNDGGNTRRIINVNKDGMPGL